MHAAVDFGIHLPLANTGSTMRIDPDVSMHVGGCPFYQNPVTGQPIAERCNPNDSADVAVVGDQLVGLIGTSATAPECAGLLAVKEQEMGGARPGNANVSVYRMAVKHADARCLPPGYAGIRQRRDHAPSARIQSDRPHRYARRERFRGRAARHTRGRSETPTNP